MSTLWLTAFCYGVAFGCSASAATFFLRFFYTTRDPLFAWFAGAFALLGLHWAALVGANPAAESRPYYYLVRLTAFVMIIIAATQKNRRGAG